MIIEKRKIPGISYAFTKDGIELPVLDVTHPLFVSAIDEAKLQEMIKEIGNDAAKRAENFNRIPPFIKRFFVKRSYIMAGLMEMTSGNQYVSGLSTMMMKLGPGLIGKGRKKMFDRLASKTSGSIMIRMRARDISFALADAVKKSLHENKGKNLCMINIGGGTASDSLNSLIILHKSDPSTLNGRKVEVNILDIDDYGPSFASESARILASEGGVLNGIDLGCRYHNYDWRETSPLCALMNERKDWIKVYSSEGGLFEYGDEKNILENLVSIKQYSENSTYTRITGSLLKDADSIDPIIKGTLDMITIKPKLYGLEGLKKLAGETGWRIERISDRNPRYVIFTLIIA